MINEPLYKKTVDILYQAYFNDTLEHGNCYACAVGNIVAGNCGYEFKQARNYCDQPLGVHTGCGNLFWNKDNYFNDNATYYALNFGSDDNEPTLAADDQIKSSGYSLFQLHLIEKAFESVTAVNEGLPKYTDEEMFNGLVAVLEVLKEIHQVTDDDLITTNHKRFSDHYSSLVK